MSLASLDEYRRRCKYGATGDAACLAAAEERPEIPVDATSGALIVELRNGRRIEVGGGFDATTFERLSNVLEPA